MKVHVLPSVVSVRSRLTSVSIPSFILVDERSFQSCDAVTLSPPTDRPTDLSSSLPSDLTEVSVHNMLPLRLQQQQQLNRLPRFAIAVSLRLLLVQSHQPTDLQRACADNRTLLAYPVCTTVHALVTCIQSFRAARRI
jgi:hypothetical protein